MPQKALERTMGPVQKRATLCNEWKNEIAASWVCCTWMGRFGPCIKAELQQTGIFFPLNLLPLDFLSKKTLEIEKTKTALYTTFKTGIIKVVLVFWFSMFLLTKIPREGNWVRFSCSNSALVPDKFSYHYKAEWVLELVYHFTPGQIWTESQ